ncbi:hypothetical protein [Limosilactobacillus sp.]
MHSLVNDAGILDPGPVIAEEAGSRGVLGSDIDWFLSCPAFGNR